MRTGRHQLHELQVVSRVCLAFLKIDDYHPIAASGEGTIQSFDLRQKKPDIQSEMFDGELNCMGTVRNGTKLVVGCGTGPLYLFR